jgi:hypothetical protein
VNRDANPQDTPMVKQSRSICILTLALLVPAAWASQEPRQAGPPPYDVTSERTVAGTVVGTATISPAPDRQMLYLTLTVDGRPLEIILAPPAWVKKQAFVFTVGATAEVTGVPGMHLNGEAAMMARTLKVGAHTLTVRDAAGKPLWDESRPARAATRRAQR